MAAAVCRPELPEPDRRGKGLGTANTGPRMPAAAMKAGIVAALTQRGPPHWKKHSPEEEAGSVAGPAVLPRAGGGALVPAGPQGPGRRPEGRSSDDR